MKKVYSRKPARKKQAPRYQFDGIHDTPSGASYIQHADGIEVSAPARNYLIGVLLTALAVLVGYGLYATIQADEEIIAPYMLWGLLGFLLAILIPTGPYFLFGRVSFRITETHLIHKKSVFGIGIRQKLRLEQVTKVRMSTRSLSYLNYGSHLGYVFPIPTESKFSDKSIVLETRDREIVTGLNMRDKALHYLHYVVVDSLRSFHRQKKKSA